MSGRSHIPGVRDRGAHRLGGSACRIFLSVPPHRRSTPDRRVAAYIQVTCKCQNYDPHKIAVFLRFCEPIFANIARVICINRPQYSRRRSRNYWAKSGKLKLSNLGLICKHVRCASLIETGYLEFRRRSLPRSRDDYLQKLPNHGRQKEKYWVQGGGAVSL